MTLQFLDRVRVATATTGTGPITIGAAQAGFTGFGAMSVGNTSDYVIEDTGGAYEVGIGTLSASNIWQRTTIVSSSNGGAALNLSGNATLYLSWTATRAAAAIAATNLTAYTGNGGASGTPLFPVVDAATGTIYMENLTSFNALLSGGSIAIPATAFTVALATTALTVGTPANVTVTPTGGPWNGQTITPSSTVAGTFSPTSATPSGTTPQVFAFTPSAAGSGNVTVAASPTMTNTTGAVAITSVAATTISSAVIAANGTTLTMTFNQAVTLNTSDITFSAGSFTNTDAATSSTTHVFTLTTVVNSGVSETYTTSNVAFTSPALAAIASNVAVTNNSTQSASGVTINFTGAAGAPSGTQVRTQYGSASIAGDALDGAGNINLGTTQDAVGIFQAAGMQGDGTLKYTFKSGSSFATDIVFRASTPQSTGSYYQLNVSANAATMYLYKIVAGTVTSLGNAVTTAFTPTSFIAITISGNTFTISIDQGTLGSFTDSTGSPIVGPGYIGIGPGSTAQVSLSQVSIH